MKKSVLFLLVTTVVLFADVSVSVGQAILRKDLPLSSYGTVRRNPLGVSYEGWDNVIQVGYSALGDRIYRSYATFSRTDIPQNAIILSVSLTGRTYSRLLSDQPTISIGRMISNFAGYTTMKSIYDVIGEQGVYAYWSGNMDQFTYENYLIDDNTIELSGKAVEDLQASSFHFTVGFKEVNNKTNNEFFTSGVVALKLSVTYQLPYVNVDKSSLVLGYQANNSGTINVSSNTSWTVSDNGSWLDVAPVSSSSNGQIIASANSSNPNSTVRTATITVTANGGDLETITVTQNGVPTITLSPGSISFPNTIVGNRSPAQSYQVTGSGLIGNINITAPSGFEISSNGSSYSGSIALSPTNTNVNSTIYTRFSPAQPSLYTGAITHISSGAVQKNLQVSGTGLCALTVTPSNQSVPNTSGSTNFNVSTTCSWTASSNQSWCTVTSSGTGNGTLTATYTQNTGVQRTANITVSAGNASPVVVTVTQAPGCSLAVTPSNQSVANTSGSTTFSVSTSCAWTASSNQTWCTVTSSGTGNGTLTATYTQNTGVQRTANITVSAGTASPVVVTVTQAPGCSLAVTPSNQSVANTSGSTTFSVSTSCAWTASSNQTWCTVTPSGTGNGTLTATYTQNTGVQRTANITVSAGTASPVVVTVTQAPGCSLAVTPSNQSVANTSGSTTFSVSTSCAWTASSNQTWCTVTPSGTGNGNLTATYTQNTGSARSASITVTVSGANPIIVTVNQAGPCSLSVTPSTQSVTNTSGSTTFSVSTSCAWTASSNQTWCTVTPSGTGNGNLTATYTQNTGSARSASITVTVSGANPIIVTVNQAGPCSLSVTPSIQSVGNTSGTTSFTVSTSCAWTASSNQTWCTVTPSGTGNGTLTATYTQNTGSERSASITITVSGANPIIVTVNQAGPCSLSVTPSTQSVTNTSGSTTFSVSTSCAWTASSNQTWCTVTPSGTGNGNLTATYTQNTGSARSASITVTVSGANPIIVTVNQAGPCSLSVTPSIQSVTNTSGSTTFSVSTSCAWTASSNQTWCTVTPSGTGNGTLTATYTQNTGSERSASITVTVSGANPVIVTLNQSIGGCNHNWTTVTYSNSTTAYGVVTVNGNPASPEDFVGAFVGTECRAFQQVVLNAGTAYVTLVIQGVAAEAVTFKVWDASACAELPASPTITSNPGGIVGLPTFIQIGASDKVLQTIPMTSNWSLVSLYVKSANHSPAEVFAKPGCGVVEVKNMTQSYNSGVPDFLNTLKTLVDGDGYFVKSANACNATVEDQLVQKSYTIDFSPSWNLKGFPSHISSGLPGAAQSLIDGNKLQQIKNMTKSYDPILPDFLNTLKCLTPGEGYFVKMANTHSGFLWSDANCAGELKSDLTHKNWEMHGYQQSMVVYGEVTFNGVSLDEQATVGAFVNGQCRGIGDVVFHGGKSYTTIVVNGESSETAEFRLLYKGLELVSEKKLKTIPGETTFEIVSLDFGGIDSDNRLKVSPNPFQGELLMELFTNDNCPVVVTVHSIDGRLIREFTLAGPSGYRQLVWNGRAIGGESCKEGVYLIKANLTDAIVVKRAILTR